MNTLYFGDNLEILRDKIPSESVDLIYLDPPFQSGKSYNIIFQPQAGTMKGATAQIHTFEDTWSWGDEAEREYRGLIECTLTKEKPGQKLIDLMKAMRGYLAECPMMAYLCMMAPRLLEMRRVLKTTGSIYLHCDPVGSHYLKLLLDSVFGVDNFLNEIVWKRTSGHSDARRCGNVHDVVLLYSKSPDYRWNDTYQKYDPAYAEQYYRYRDDDGRRFMSADLTGAGSGPARHFGDRGEIAPPSGRHWMYDQRGIDRMLRENRVFWTRNGVPRFKKYLDEAPGMTLQDVWTDIQALRSWHEERLGYPTQKPEALLERIIQASSNEGDTVLDPFCGCGTTVAVAERLNRKWIGIDITYLSIDVIKKRFEKNGIKEGVRFEIEGEPKDTYSAEQLAKSDPFQFQLWCLSKLNATPSATKSGDKGVDGFLNYFDPTEKSKVGKLIIQVKGTQTVNPAMVRDLKGTMKSQSADFAILITLKEPTKDMRVEAVKEGQAEYMSKHVPRMQLLTVDQLLEDPIPVKLPGNVFEPYKKPDIRKDEQLRLTEE